MIYEPVYKNMDIPYAAYDGTVNKPYGVTNLANIWTATTLPGTEIHHLNRI